MSEKTPVHVQKIAEKYAYSSPINYRGEVIVCVAPPGTTEIKVKSHTPYGYRKNTTGEYVSNSYRTRFGWKNTYYQNAETYVYVPLEYWW